MINPRRLYNLGYRFFRMPWELGPRPELVELVRTGRLGSGRAIDLGCGTGANAIYLAAHGFDVTGVDFSSAALSKAAVASASAGVQVNWIEADLTALPALGTFDVLIDYGTLDDLTAARRDRYVANVVPLAAPGAHFLLWCFEWPPRRWERRLGFLPMVPGEVHRRFGTRFDIERIAGTETPNPRRLIAGTAAYLMTLR